MTLVWLTAINSAKKDAPMTSTAIFLHMPEEHSMMQAFGKYAFDPCT